MDEPIPEDPCQGAAGRPPADDGLYAAVGGFAGIRAAADLLYRRMLDDPGLTDRFRGTDPDRLAAHQGAFLTALLGGPDLYTGGDLGAVHASLALSDADFEALCNHLAAVLRDLGVAPTVAAQVVDRLDPMRSAVLGSADG
ncbi:group 1 truncated hemoglobin [Streptomyces caeni]|uniref:Group 1 truncated hemoglobin n=1 Tax=Streptomyces caeni TaxID=2307231 RepID=A0ABW4IMB5_9ACTN